MPERDPGPTPGTPSPAAPGSAEATSAAKPAESTAGTDATGAEATETAGAEASAPSGPRRRARTIALTSLLAVGVAGAVAAGFVGWRIISQKDATVAAPAQVADLPRDDSDNGRSTAEYLQTALVAEVDLDDTVAAAYQDPAGRGVLFVGGTGLVWQPEDELTKAFRLVSDAQGAVTHVHEVPAGPLGGTVKCGRTPTDDGDMAVCGWADHGSVALALFPKRSEDESAKLILSVREAAQKRD
ncbi:hypothetical protein [Krasilnikovia sp. M28-CT-15]|uniref:hypothetical protein n=1 Tax=Krasilnikovia sp. M28-CT-15 TaxID=3373540 RepID=UPI003875E6D5